MMQRLVDVVRRGPLRSAHGPLSRDGSQATNQSRELCICGLR